MTGLTLPNQVGLGSCAPAVIHMAQMIPDKLPSNHSQGEARLFGILRRLPDDYLVYYEPVIRQKYPDFVVVAPDLGVLVIEVKGWQAHTLLGGDQHEILVRNREVPQKREKHPTRQARDYQNHLRDECRRHPEAVQLLMHPDGPHQGKFLFPFGHFAVLSNLTTDQLKGHAAGDLTAIFPPTKVLPREALLRWEELPPANLVAELKNFFDPFWPITPLTSRQLDVLRGIIHPEIILPSVQGTVPLSVLDIRQERHARAIGDGHRLIYGVAGSGKTVLLISRAKHLSAEYQQADHGGSPREILVLCFNVSLAAHLNGALRGCTNVSVFHFDGWAKAQGCVRQQVPVPAPVGGGPGKRRPETDREVGERLRDRLRDGQGDFERYEAVLIDEAQDFDRTWFECVLAAMRDPLDGNLLIVGDRHQGIRGPKTVRWSSVGIKARGRTAKVADFDLDKNYRNSKEIVELAEHFARDHPGVVDEDEFEAVAVDSSKAVRSTGVCPVLMTSNSPKEECGAVVGLVTRLLHKGGQPVPGVAGPLQPAQIGILYPGLFPSDREVFTEFLAQLGKVAKTTWLKDDDRVRVLDQAVKVQTMHTAKGLQYRAVILLWAGRMPRTFGDVTEEEETKLMYVALTRAEDYLFISYSHRGAFISRLDIPGKVTHLRV
jgi:hypothetical protein